MSTINQTNKNSKKLVSRITYRTPQLVRYGALRDLTQSGTGNASESNKAGGGCIVSLGKKPCSERRVKENIVRIGDHPLGFGLYLFDYKPEYRDFAGHGRQFGVMIDEVEIVMPEAVSPYIDGFMRVDYTMLGIEQAVN